MPDAANVVSYASGIEESSIDRLLRRIVGVSAVTYGAAALADDFFFVASAYRWFGNTNGAAYMMPSGCAAIIYVIGVAAKLGILLGAMLLLRRIMVGALLIRFSAALLVLGALFGLLGNLLHFFPDYLLGPTTAAVLWDATRSVIAMLPATMIFLLTLPGLAVRMVGNK